MNSRSYNCLIPIKYKYKTIVVQSLHHILMNHNLLLLIIILIKFNSLLIIILIRSNNSLLIIILIRSNNNILIIILIRSNNCLLIIISLLQLLEFLFLMVVFLIIFRITNNRTTN